MTAGTVGRQPLFILCPGRSYSSVVCAAIGQHPDAMDLPELNLFICETVGDLLALSNSRRGFSGALTGLRRALAQLLHGVQSDESVERVDEWLAARGDWTSRRVLLEIQDLAGGRMIVEKSPTNTRPDSLRRLATEFPSANYLHLARHPRGTLRSFYTNPVKRTRSARSRLKSKGYWLARHKAIIEFTERLAPSQHMYLQGEWFLENPDLFLRQLCGWLELRDDDEAIALMKRPENSPFSSEGPQAAAAGTNRAFIKAPELRVGKVAEERLEGRLEWIEGRDVYLDAETIMLARMLGYR